MLQNWHVRVYRDSGRILSLRVIILFLCVCFASASFSQSPADNWYFGTGAGVSFTGGTPLTLTGGMINSSEGVASLSDANGNLLFYTDGLTVYNRNHIAMPNGNGLLGGSSSSQSAVAMPKPGSSTLYYLFTADQDAEPDGIRYSVIDITLNAGLGDIVAGQKNILLLAPATEKLTAVKHCNNRDNWIIAHDWGTNQFYAWLLTPAGISSSPVISSVGAVHDQSVIGCMKVAPNGSKVAVAVYDQGGQHFLQAFDFNSSNGQITNPITKNISGSAYGLEFSPNSQYLYYTSANTQTSATIGINQIDLCAGSTAAILASETAVGSTSDGFIRTLQLGPDGKLYFARFGQPWIGLIPNPNVGAPGCGFQPNGISLGTGVCRAGLPNFNQSFFDPILEFDANSTCLNATFSAQSIYDNATCLNPISGVTWNFGEPSSGASNSSTQIAPSHTYNAAGNYLVRLIVNYPCGADTIYQTVNIQCGLQVTMPAQSICQGQCANLQATVTGGVPPYTWSWTGVSASVAGPVNVCPTTTTTYSATVTDYNGLTATVSATVTVNSLPNPSVSVIPVTCNGLSDGGASVTIAGGPYTFSWNSVPVQTGSTLSNVPGGIYNVTITNAQNCQKVVPANVIQPAPLSFNIHVISSACGQANGSSTMIPVGGTAPYSYVWNTIPVQTTATASNLPAGNYHVDLTDANGCTQSADVQIDNHIGHSAYIDFLQPISCQGGSDGSLIAIPLSGTPPFNYLWSNGQTTQIATGLAAGTHTVQVSDVLNCPLTYSYTIDDAPGMGIQVNVTDAVCGQLNGAASLTLTGGFGPFTINWASNPGQNVMAISNVHAGANSVSVSDQVGCTYTTNFTINSSPAPQLQINANQLISCVGATSGSLTAIASAGTPPYTYVWSNGATTATINNLGPANYSCSISDAAGCTTNAAFQLVNPPAITIMPGITQASCGQNNGSISISVTGGTPPYQIAWAGGQTTSTISNLAAGSYSVTVTDANSCVQQAAFSVSAAGGPALTLTSSNPVSCFGLSNGSASVTISGGSAPYTTIWNDGNTNLIRSNLAAGIYNLNVTDALGCLSSLNVSISEPAPISATWNLTPATCNQSNGSAEVLVSGGNSPYTFVWSGGQSTSILSAQAAGPVSVTVSDANACQQTFTNTILGSGAFSAAINQLNPVSCNGSSDAHIETQLSGGNSPFTFLWSNGATGSDLSSIPSGTYSVSVTDALGCIATASHTIAEPPAIVMNATIAPSTCGLANGSIQLNISGAQVPLSITWSDGQVGAVASFVSSGSYTASLTDNAGCTAQFTGTVTDIGGPTLLLVSSSDVACNADASGSLEVSASGGVLPYTMQWNDGGSSLIRTNLLAGTYSLTVTDNSGCSSQITVPIAEPSAITASWNIQSESCGSGNGAAEVLASGGTAPYTYSWVGGQTANNISSQTAGPVSVTITDAVGCSASFSNTIDAVSASPASISISASVTCHDSSDATIQVISSQPVQVTWADGGNSTGRSNIPAGIYTAYIIDGAGCFDTLTVDVFNPPAITASINTVDATCSAADGSAQISYSGGTGSLSHTWMNGTTSMTANNLAFGPVSAVITDINGCALSVNAQIGTISPLQIDTIITVSPGCPGGNNGSASAQISGNTGALTYVWSNGATSSSVNGLSAGNYTLTITDASACSELRSFQIVDPLALSAQITPTDALCFGASNGQANVSVSGGMAPYSVIWANGQTSFTRSDLAAGTHGIIIQDNQGCQLAETVVILQPDSLVASISSLPATCGANSGSAEVVVQGGTLPYFYMWSNASITSQATGLAAGTANVLVTDANGCQRNFTSQIQSAASTAVQLNVNQPVSCFGGADAELEVISSAPVTVQWSDGNTQTLRSSISAGNYSVITTDAGGCNDTLSVQLSQPARLSHNFSVSPATCTLANGSASIAVTGGTLPYTYLWSNGSGSAAQSAVASGNISVQVTDANSCLLQADTLIPGQNPLIINQINTQNVSCFGLADGAANAIVSGATGNAMYAWSSGSSSANAVNLAAGNYSVIVSDDAGCSRTSSFTIDSPSELVATILGEDATCFGYSDARATVFANGGTLPYTYSWDGIPGTDVNTSLSAGDHVLVVADVNNCSIQQIVSVGEPNELVVMIDVQAATCGLANGAMEANVTGGTMPYQYVWSSGESSADLSGLLPGAFSVSVTDANGCSSNLTKSFEDVGPPIIQVSNSSNVSCFNGGDGAVEVLVSGGTGVLETLWNTGANGLTLTNLGVGTYSATVTDALGCSSSVSHTVTQPLELVSNLQSHDVNCYGGNSGSIVTHITGGTPAYSTTIVALGTTQVESAMNLSANVYAVTIVDANGCQLIDTIGINQPEPLSIALSSTDVLCFGGSDGTANASVVGGTLPYNFAWSSGDTTNAIENQPTGNYVLTVTDANQCTLAESVFIDQPDLLQVTISGPTEICAGEVVNFSMFGSGGFGDYAVQWMTGQTNESISFVSDSTMSISLVLTDENQCTVSCTRTLMVHQLPVIQLTPMSSTSCAGDCVQVETSLVEGGIYTWTTGLGAKATGRLVSFCFDKEGQVDLRLQVTDIHGCSSSADFEDYFTIHPLPTASFTVSETNVPLLDALIYFNNSSLNAVSSEWNFDDRIVGEESTSNSASYHFIEIGSYPVTLKVWNEFGCADQTVRWVEITEDFAVYIPNAFTPNSDGLNDGFKPLGIGYESKNYSFTIFDRWGKLVFATDDPYQAWDGTYQVVETTGNALTNDVFVWKLQVQDFRGLVHDLNGTVTLVR